MKKKILKTIALVVALALIGFLAVFANSMVGNPVSRWLAKNALEEHLKTNYPGTDYEVESFGFTFKTSDYYAHIRSDSSMDTQFTVYIDLLGRVRRDTFDSVTQGFVTARRLEDEYRALTDAVFANPLFPYEMDIDYGMLETTSRQALEDPNVTDIPPWALIIEDLILDHVYDIRELGAQAGHLVVYVYSDTLDVETAAQVLLDIRAEFDRANVPFRAISLTLRAPKTEEAWDETYIGVDFFDYQDIYEEGLVERVARADAELKAYREQQDKEMQAYLETLDK